MNTYTIKRSEPGRALIDNYPWTAEYPPVIKAYAELTYDDTALHVKLAAEETNLRIETKLPNEMVCQDSCLEFFFNPMPEEGDKYLNFEFNPAGNYWLSIGDGRSPRTCMELTEFSYDFAVATTVCDDSWDIRFSIPFEFLQEFFPEFAAEKGTEMRGNFYKCGDLTDHTHYGSWSPVVAQEPDFHRPECFGKLVFE